MLLFLKSIGENVISVHCSLYFAACLKYFIMQKKVSASSYKHKYNKIFIPRK